MSDERDLKNRFGYHAPKDEQTTATHRVIRRMHYALAFDMNNLLPEGREKALVLTHLETAMMWANAAVARQGPITEDPDDVRP